MGQRLDLQTTMEEVLSSRNVYFQPTANIQMQYPCIVYEVDRMAAKYANNAVYLNKVGYQGKLITRNPDDAVLMKLLGLPLCRFVRHFITDNLHHYVFTIYS